MSIVPGWGPPVLQARQTSLQMVGSVDFDGTGYLSISSFASSSPDRTRFTLSVWAKGRENPVNGGKSVVLLNENPTGLYVWEDGDGNDRIEAFLGPIDQFSIGAFENNAFGYTLNQWYHFVVGVDTTLGTAADRVKLYRDGVQLSPTDSKVPSQNAECSGLFVNGDSVYIGHDLGESSPVDMKLGDLCMVEGQQLAPGDFGYDNSGTWSWKNYEGGYGAHGYRILPQNSSEIGKDQSGNGHDFTLNSMDSGDFDTGDLPPL